MGLSWRLSLRDRFLIAPFIGVFLTIALYLTSNAIILSHSDLFQQLSRQNLPQVSEIGRVSVLLSKSHNRLISLLLAAAEIADEEQVYLQGRDVLNGLHALEKQFDRVFSYDQKIIINDQDIDPQIRHAFSHYKKAAISAIELSSVDTKLAKKELLIADAALQEINNLLLSLSEYHVKNLAIGSGMVESSLDDHDTTTALAAVFILMMLLSAVYFSRHLSSDLELINQALIKLADGESDIQLPEQSDEYLSKASVAVLRFRHTLEQNQQQQDNLKQAMDRIKDSETQFRSIFESAAVAMIVIDAQGMVTKWNTGAVRIFGYTANEIIGRSLVQIIPEPFRSAHTASLRNAVKSAELFHGGITHEFSGLRKNGQIFPVQLTLSCWRQDGEMNFSSTVLDITERKQAEDRMMHQAHFDSLTNLPNRFLSLDRLSQLISKAQRNDTMVAVLFLDLDDFKKVNDSMGHETGDKLLIETAERLDFAVRKDDTVGRLGGDEFIILLGGLNGADAAIPIAENILTQLGKPFSIDARELILTASVGIAVYPGDAGSASELLRNADSAMYHAKELGRNTYSYFTEKMNRLVSRRLALEEQMHGALDRCEFFIHYQPQVDVSSGKIVGAEALLRWENPVLGEVFPDEFIPISEQTCLIIPLGEYVLRESVALAVQWQQKFSCSFRMAVNLSPRQFRDPGLVGFIRALINQSGISASSLELEITEGVLMSGHSYIDKALSELNALGVELAMDDFGTGYSSLSYLRNYPFDILKIDRSFVNDIMTDMRDRKLINAAIAMAHSLDLKVVAEGVETKEQLLHLETQGCEYAQGYYFSKPVPPEVMFELLVTQENEKA
ncbi:MAG TPA: EAL domain-containing protein [Gammaproteobacteria bacterium]|nr:EAL domain-containing protein [Gammaproteobacteria bacterium]